MFSNLRNFFFFFFWSHTSKKAGHKRIIQYALLCTYVSRLKNGLLKDINRPSSGNCDCVAKTTQAKKMTLKSKQNPTLKLRTPTPTVGADMIKLRTLKGRDYTGLSGWSQCNHRSRRESQRRSCGFHSKVRGIQYEKNTT